ncbi:MAG: peptidase S41 [Acidobacteria bacterium]|nr:peptidase S41 [Acidobacteriota bacterium]
MRRTVFNLLLILAATVLALPASAIEAHFARQPAPSPDGSVIAFSWQGDIWLVPSSGGEARRLTANPAADRHPVFSRDGRWIAFASSRYGSYDVFVVPVDGGAPPLRLTFASVDDIPVDFTPDGRSVLFVSRRAESIRWMPALYTVPIGGGTPALAQPALGQTAAYSPDGRSLVFVRGATKWTRRGYRGAANRDLWLRTPAGSYRQLTTFDGDDDDPSWVIGGGIAFLSARSGRKNVFVLDPDSGKITQLTHHRGSDVRAPRAAADGSLIAYELEDGLWTVTPGGGKPTRLSITAPADAIVPRIERHVDGKGADELAVSPDGKLAAFVVHGEVFVTAARSKDEQAIAPSPTVRITRTAAREKDVRWSPDGASLLFTSDRAGNDDLYLAKPADPKAGWLESFELSVTRLTSSPAEEYGGRFSPDGTHIAFVRGRGDLVVMAADGSGEKTILEHWQTPEFDWSPDGRWIAYSIPDMEYNTEIWLVPASGGTPYNVSRHPDDDVSPRFSPDGRRLVWLSHRHADTFDVWGVWLTRADDERTPEGWLRVFSAKDKPKKQEHAGEEKEASADTKAAPKKELPKVHIDFKNLWRRVEGITRLEGDEEEPLVSADGKRILFTAAIDGKRDLYSVRFDGKDLKRLTTGGTKPTHIQLAGKGDTTAFFLDGSGKIGRVSLDGKAGDPVPFTARYEVDRAAQQRQVFDEAWRALDMWFYDPHFHGVDWPAQRTKYGAWLQGGMDPADFADLVNLMLGELNSSHMGYYPSRGPAAKTKKRERTGYIGALFDPTAGGPGIRVREVLPESPAAGVAVHLAAGERLLSVNGRAVTPSTNVYALFTDTVGQRIPIRIRDAAGKERTAAVVPVGFRRQRQLRYETWVRQRRALVEELSGGTLGYVHIQGMDIPSFEVFERNLYAAGHGKQGLIIDVRSNGGGWTTDYLMAVLDVRRHAYTLPRGGNPRIKAYPQGRLPLAAWTRPAAALCNEDSYSNAEIFSHAFKTLDRGPLVGSPTFGAVISTGGMYTLNGALVRLPSRGWYVAGSGINMEHHGAVPDVIVWQPPAEDTSADTDTQLAKAVQVLLKDIPNDPRRGMW